MKVIVMGAGVVGPSVAFRLAEAGADGAGRIMAQAEDLEFSLTLDAADGTKAAVAAEVLRRASSVGPGMGGVTAEAVRIAMRPIPEDGSHCRCWRWRGSLGRGHSARRRLSRRDQPLAAPCHSLDRQHLRARFRQLARR